jgi:hypothetical protein
LRKAIRGANSIGPFVETQTRAKAFQATIRSCPLFKTGLCSRIISLGAFVPELSKRGGNLKVAPNLLFSFQIVERRSQNLESYFEIELEP